MPTKKQKGQQGEQLAKLHLQNKGYKLLAQNFHTRFGEIDLIFRHSKTTVFVEVKTRKTFTQGFPEEAVTPKKLKTISHVAEIFMQKHHLSSQLARIDVVAIELTSDPPVLRHHQNVAQFSS